MAGSEGAGQTELLTGWSCIVHRPSEDPEPSELPSTVDMAAFSAGLTVEPTSAAQGNDNSDSDSDSEAEFSTSGSASASCSQSESSDSDSSSSSQESSSRSPSPEFSVTSSQTNGLRLTIATVRKSCSSPIEKAEKGKPTAESKSSDKPIATKGVNLSSSSDSPCSKTETDSNSESDELVSKSDNKKNVKKSVSGGMKTRTKASEKKVEKKVVKKSVVASPKTIGKSKAKQRRGRKMASLPVNRGYSYTSTDSDDSDADSAMLASCSLQEIRQEDLAAILPDQQDCDAFGGFESRADKNSTQTGDASGSDMELPQQALNALIQRTTESSSESESHAPPNPSSLYANSLLQQFVAQTQLLNAPCAAPPQNNESAATSGTTSEVFGGAQGTSSSKDASKKRRGRPRRGKQRSNECNAKMSAESSVPNGDFCGNPNVSPDSGIQNSPDHVSSPESSPSPDSKSKYNRDTDAKNKKPSNKSITNSKVATAVTNISSKPTANASSTASKIKEQSKVPVTSNRFDRLLYANADRVLYPPRRKAGRPPANRKGPGRPAKPKPLSAVAIETNKPEKPSTAGDVDKPANNVKPSVEKNSSKPSKTKKIHNNTKDKDMVQLTSNTSSLSLGKTETKVNGIKEISHRKTKSKLLFEICERVSKRLELNNKYVHKTQDGGNKQEANSKSHRKAAKLKTRKNRHVLESRNKLVVSKTQYTTLKNAKLMHSKHKHKKHKKCKFKIIKPITAATVDSKINTEIDKLIADFMKFCSISSVKPAKENIPEIFKAFKKASKKRKTSEYSERKKKKQTVNSTLNKETNSNEQRLPLKKRHYHLSANNENKSENTEVKVPSDSLVENKTKSGISKTSVQSNSKAPSKAVTQATEASKATNVACAKYIPVIKSPNSTGPPKVTNINNNEYSVASAKSESVRTHIDEAIEACITRYAEETSAKQPKIETSPKEEKANVSSSSITTTTPKKRHRLEVTVESEPVKVECNLSTVPENDTSKTKNKTSLESVVSELKMKKNLPHKPVETSVKKTEKKVENVAQIITRKKNRLEDLTSTLASKINVPASDVSENQKRKKEVKTEEANRDSVIKYPICKKAKPAEPEKLDFIDAKPTGIFMPTVDLEVLIPKSTVITTTGQNVEKTVEVKKTLETTAVAIDKPKLETVPNKPFQSDALKRKIRKRRAINRTGFPTVKKKKKKVLNVEPTENEAMQKPSGECDRVPKTGEELSKFLQRTEKCSVLTVDPLQKTQPDIVSTNFENDSKWEALSECDSLPQDERTEIEQDDLRLDVKQEKMNLRGRDLSPATSVDTTSSKSKNKRDATPSMDDLDDVPLEMRVAKMKGKLKNEPSRKKDVGKKGLKASEESTSFHAMQKRKFRDVSPASSVEQFLEKRLKEERASASGDEMKRNRKVPRWRKKYLIAGLFSDYYKEDDEAVLRKRRESLTNKKLVYKPEEHPYGLLPPPYHCGKYLRCRRVPFQLPYDLWWQHTHSQLPGRDIVPSWNYRKIRTNVYNVKTTTGACEPQACNCTSISGCGDDCINRLVLAECPASHKCRNQKIQKHEWAPGLEKFMTEAKGWGVRTKEAIKNGEFILEYVGEVVSDQEFKERMATRYIHDTHHYCLHLDGGLVIDGHRMGGDGRFVNHSCQPNCEMQKWSVNGQFRMALFALRDIQCGEELTYDYNFSLFNPAEGQECKCGSDNCRGVIGGKSQRVRQSTAVSQGNGSSGGGGRVGRPRKNPSKRATSKPKEQAVTSVAQPVMPAPVVKPMSHQQRCYVLEHHCFLLRNLTKVKRMRERSVGTVPLVQVQVALTAEHSATAFVNHLNALQKPRNMRTRRLAQAEDDPELNKTAKLATILQDLYNVVITSKDENNELLSTPLLVLPSKRKVPEYYQRISEPIDLTTIEQNIATGVYRSADNFDSDMNRLFNNCVRFYGRTSELGIAATRLKKVFSEAKEQSLSRFEEIIGEKPPPNFASNKKKCEEEDVIRCICGMFRDEGLMIQCERCLVWQHCECVKADPAAASYHCERCVPRTVDYEIAMNEYTEHGHRYYMTLLRGDLQLRQGDTVYVLRDIPIPGTDRKHTYSTVGEIKYSDLDIFRIERLWKDSQSGQRFAYGHHYLRPHETYHEPTRRFFPNEVMRVPLYEAVPVELIISHCWVMDLNTYCKGRPIGAPEEHIYICEYRVDKTARLFSKISKSKYPICTKSYAFDRFDARLKISRTYTPHDLDPAYVKPRGRKTVDSEEIREVHRMPLHVPVIRTKTEQKARLNRILLNLLSKLPTKQALDLSYLLEGGRRRKKPA